MHLRISHFENYGGGIMSISISPKDNAVNIQNANKGTNGTNKQYSQNQGNSGKQLSPNQKGK